MAIQHKQMTSTSLFNRSAELLRALEMNKSYEIQNRRYEASSHTPVNIVISIEQTIPLPHAFRWKRMLAVPWAGTTRVTVALPPPDHCASNGADCITDASNSSWSCPGVV